MVDLSMEARTIQSLIQGLDDLERRHVPWAVADAVNRSAQDVLTNVRSKMAVVFDRPTRFTENAFQILPRATKAKPEATVGERPSVEKRHYLKVEEAGGPRGQTSLEKLLSMKVAWSGLVRSVIPATGSPFEAAKLDRHGNWSTGERNQVLSALGAQRDNRSNTTKASKNRAKGRASYFVPQHGLAPGVYRRKRPGDIPVRVLKFSDKTPTYRPTLRFLEGAEQVFAERIAVNFTDALAKALATAR